MSSPWIQHVKQYQANHGGTYKEAMSASKATYMPMNGGKFNVKTAARKTVNTVKKGAKMGKKGLKATNAYYDANQELIGEVVGSERAAELMQARKTLGDIDQLTGGKFKLDRAIKKTKRIARIAAPILSVVAPEVGIPLTTALALSGGSFKVHGSGVGGVRRGYGYHIPVVKLPNYQRDLSDPNR